MSGTVQKMEVPNLPYLKRILHRGKEGKDVKKVQQRLDTLNAFYRYHSTPSLEDTGTFGSKTHSFVVRFQLWADLCADGWVDKKTADTIEDFFQAIAQTYTSPSKPDPFDKY